MHGSLARDHHIAIGYNSRLDEIHAAILRVKLTHLDRWNEARREAAQWYAELLRDVPEIQLPVERPGDHHVYGQYTIRVLNGRRDALQARAERTRYQHRHLLQQAVTYAARIFR